MDYCNNYHPRYVPPHPKRVPLVDQYMWDKKDFNEYHAVNGVSFPIYSPTGCINKALPLHMWPRVGTIHPEIAKSWKDNANVNFRRRNFDGVTPP